MESTKLIQAIEELSAQYGSTPSYMQVARDAVLKQLAAKNHIEMPAILDEEQRKVFMDNIDHLAGFLKSEDGADAIEFLVNTYQHYCDKEDAQEEEKDTPEVETEEDE